MAITLAKALMSLAVHVALESDVYAHVLCEATEFQGTASAGILHHCLGLDLV